MTSQTVEEKLNQLYDILKDVEEDIKPDDGKFKLLQIKTLFYINDDKTKDQRDEETKDKKENKKDEETEDQKDDQKDDEKTNLINDILKMKKIKLSTIYENYKTELIIKKQKDDVKNILINNEFINPVKNKNDKITSYSINESKKEDFKIWLNENLI